MLASSVWHEGQTARAVGEISDEGMYAIYADRATARCSVVHTRRSIRYSGGHADAVSIGPRGCHAMPKSEVVSAARRKRGRREAAELADAVAGQIAELCRDLAVQVKRTRQLQEQADELRVVIREWASWSAPAPAGEPASRAGRR
jgi:hypothetical protein